MGDVDDCSEHSQVAGSRGVRVWIRRLRRLRSISGDPARVGDAAVLTCQLLGVRMGTDVCEGVQRLYTRRGAAASRPTVDYEALRELPRGTFGRAFVDFCTTNGIEPVAISDGFAADDGPRSRAIARYIATHDMFHVLLGYDTSLSGELAVSGFVLGQRYFSRVFLAFQCLVVVLSRPHRALQLVGAFRRGLALGQRAPLLLTEPFEDHFAEDLERLQVRLGLRDEASIAVRGISRRARVPDPPCNSP